MLFYCWYGSLFFIIKDQSTSKRICLRVFNPYRRKDALKDILTFEVNSFDEKNNNKR